MRDPLLGRRLLWVAMCERLAGDSADSIMWVSSHATFVALSHATTIKLAAWRHAHLIVYIMCWLHICVIFMLLALVICWRWFSSASNFSGLLKFVVHSVRLLQASVSIEIQMRKLSRRVYSLLKPRRDLLQSQRKLRVGSKLCPIAQKAQDELTFRVDTVLLRCVLLVVRLFLQLLLIMSLLLLIKSATRLLLVW